MLGWIKLHRKLTEKGFYSKDSEKVHLWIHLLMKANREPREELLGGVPIRCNSGQFTCGRQQLSKETGISESKIERILTYFEKIEQQIEQQKTTKNRLITIVSWQDYQQSEQQSEQQLNNNRTTTEQQLNTLQEVKEIKEVKEKEFNAKSFLLNIFVENQVAVDFLKNRKTKRLANTETAFKQIVEEINKTGLSSNDCIKIAVENGWGGFKSIWLNNLQYGTNKQSNSKNQGASIAEIAAAAERVFGDLPDR